MTVVDANVFIRGRRTPFDSAVTVPEVLEELESEASNRKYEAADVSVMEPSEASLSDVKETSQELKAPTSKVDEKLLALAYERGDEIITDDKALQNLALRMDVDFRSYMSDPIQEKKHWEERCPSCGSEVSGNCPKCGEESIRRLV